MVTVAMAVVVFMVVAVAVEHFGGHFRFGDILWPKRKMHKTQIVTYRKSAWGHSALGDILGQLTAIKCLRHKMSPGTFCI